jgi:hypothetical protein
MAADTELSALATATSVDYLYGISGGVSKKIAPQDAATPVNPITYVGTPTGLNILIASQTLVRNAHAYSGLAATFTGLTLDGLTELGFGATKIIQSTGSGFSSAALTVVDFGEARVLNGGFTGTLNAVTTFTADSLERSFGNWAMSIDALQTMSLPAFVGGEIAWTANALTSLSLPLYEDDGGSGFLLTANSLTTLSLPSVVSIDFGINMVAASLQTFSLGSTLKSVGSDVSIAGAALNQASVDGVLVRLAALNGTGGTTSYDGFTVDLSGGTSATPGATGLTAKATLEGRGNTVTVN